MNIAVFVSGNGSNLEALIKAEKEGKLSSGGITLVISDKKDAYALERAKKAGIKTYVQEKSSYSSREAYDRDIEKVLEKENIGLIVLAGFMRILSDYFVEKYSHKMINIHPALLPSFKGAHGIKHAFDHGVKYTGVTVHFVTKELDNGPIILQEPVKMEEDDTLESLEERIHAVEHRLYPEAVKLFSENKLKIEGRRVKIKN